MDMTMDPEEEVTLSEEPEASYRSAGFWMRFWAYLIDVIILFAINGLVLSPLGFLNEGAAFDIGFWTMNGVLATIIYYVYFILMTKLAQQTVGKMILGLKVISEKAEKPNWLDVLFRELVGRFFYNAFLILKLLYIIVAFTEKKQGLHDFIGQTRVVHEKD
ncbi:MAG TPA: RDD family protein [Pseudogracilibacillus sp.]|nr:RDD family protein [Pseudogracilibacillus sp.]